jgi:hypothetical protein
LNTNLVIIPARGRPDKAQTAFDALKAHSKISDFLIGLDDDDAHNYPDIEGVIREINPRLKMNGTLNLLVNKYQDKYETITFMGDDHLVRTEGWDEKLYEPIRNRGYGISYGNDLFQGENLPTMVMMSTNISKTLGFFAPPKLIHLFMDNFWKLFGQVLGCLDYREDVVIEHMHYMAGKSQVDAQYQEVNSSEVSNHDALAFREYCETQLKDDAIKVLMEVNPLDSK